MNKIIEKINLSENVVKMVLEAPAIAQKRQAGQFIVLKIDEKGERIPLTIVDSDGKKEPLPSFSRSWEKPQRNWPK